MECGQTIRSGDRKAARFFVTLGAKLIFHLPDKGSFIICRNGTIANLSENGACILVHTMPDEEVRLLQQAGQVCTVVCEFPDSDESCTFAARLAWIGAANNLAQNRTALGLQFTEMSAPVRRRLDDLFDRLTERR